MKRFIAFILLSITLVSCGSNANVFSLQDDINLGQQVSRQVEAQRDIVILNEVEYKGVYDYINMVRDTILNAGSVEHRSDFEWRIKVIHDDSTLNAFCTPGGHIYVYTGILKFLESEEQLAGVLGHEIAHAAMRHTTRQMTKMYGMQVAMDIALGQGTIVNDVAVGLSSLKNSRKHEKEADFKSVEYLCGTPYHASAGAKFFEKIQEKGGARIPEFISTHPDPGNRIDQYYLNAQSMECEDGEAFKERYQAMLKLLP